MSCTLYVVSCLYTRLSTIELFVFFLFFFCAMSPLYIDLHLGQLKHFIILYTCVYYTCVRLMTQMLIHCDIIMLQDICAYCSEGVVQIVNGPGNDDNIVDVKPEGQNCCRQADTCEHKPEMWYNKNMNYKSAVQQHSDCYILSMLKWQEFTSILYKPTNKQNASLTQTMGVDEGLDPACRFVWS